MDTLYREEILDHYRAPRNRGRLEKPDISYEDSNPLCGDVCRIDCNIKANRIAEIRCDARGCAISQAATSMLSEMVEGKTLDEVKQLGKKDVMDLLGIELGPVRLKCALLCLKVLKGGIYGIKDWPS